MSSFMQDTRDPEEELGLLELLGEGCVQYSRINLCYAVCGTIISHLLYHYCCPSLVHIFLVYMYSSSLTSSASAVCVYQTVLVAKSLLRLIHNSSVPYGMKFASQRRKIQFRTTAHQVRFLLLYCCCNAVLPSKLVCSRVNQH